MAIEFLMPKLGLTMEEGTITEWLVADGDEVAAGDPILRIETDKTETDVEAAGTGRVHAVGVVGETYACGELVGWFLADGEQPPAGSTASPPATSASAAQQAPAQQAPANATAPAATVAAAGSGVATGRVIASPYAKRLARERGIDLAAVAGTGPGGRIVADDLTGVSPQASPGAAVGGPAGAAQLVGASRPATAAARQLADLLGVSLAAVGADPTDGRITRESVARHVRERLAAAADVTPTPAPTATQPPVATSTPTPSEPLLQTPSSVVPLRGMRGTIAKRMHESLRSMAQLTLHMDADLDQVVADRERRKAAGSAPSYTDYVIAAAARALGEHPIVNSQVTDDGIAVLPQVNVGMAVALDEGLIVPVIHATASLDLAGLSAETTRLAEAARSASLGIADLEAGTFSVSTLGMFGVDGFTPVINPPNTAILGVGRLRDDVVANDGEFGTVKRLTLSLTWDHRAFDGAPAAAFCRRIVELLASPSDLDRPVES